MSGRACDLVGKHFGRWEVLYRAPNKGTRAVWHCRCECGNENDVRGDALRRGASLSCGCLAMEHSIEVHKKYNTYFFQGDYVEIYTQHNERILVDFYDFNKVKDYYWYIDDKGYARCQICQKHIRMHQLILDCPDDFVIDHISGDVVDNRRCNLRLCTQQQNSCNCALRKDNTSGIKGVSVRYRKSGKYKYSANIGYKGKRIHLGEFYTIEEAAAARKNAEIKYYGEFSRDFGPQILTVL